MAESRDGLRHDGRVDADFQRIATGLWTPRVLAQGLITPSKGRRLYFSGVAGTGADGTIGSPGNMGAQIDRAFHNLGALLQAAGLRPANVTRLLHVFVDFAVADLDHLFRVVPSFFPEGQAPTSTGITAPSLRLPGQRYELVCDGFVPD